MNAVLWNDHPTANQIYKQVRGSMKQISLGTIYRDLNQLVDNGLLKKIEIPNESDHFDKELEHHNHMYCKKCHALFNIPSTDLGTLNHRIEAETGFQILSSDIVFVGICKNCH